MDRQKLISHASKKCDYSKWEVSKIADALLESIIETLQSGEEIRIKKFGNFQLKVRKARRTVHPKTRQPMTIPEKVRVNFIISRMFKPSQAALDRVKLNR